MVKAIMYAQRTITKKSSMLWNKFNSRKNCEQIRINRKMRKITRLNYGREEMHIIKECPSLTGFENLMRSVYHTWLIG